MKKMLLIDGNSVLFRAYYATLYSRRMSTSNGIPTNATYGFIHMILKAIDIIEPDHVLVAWDTDSQTFRKEQYPEYKGTRKAPDEELIVQFPIVREFLDAAGIKRYEEHGYEADDIIGSMSKQATGYQTTILSSDRDLLQLVDDSTHVLLMKKGISEMETMDPEALYEKYELTPKQIIDLKGLMGDASDNIPGVAGVGEKTATRLLKEYPSVEEVYENIDQIKGKLKEKLEKDKDNAFLSKQLATIYRDMELPFSLDECQFDQMDEGVNDFYQKYEMNSLIRRQASKPKTVKECKRVQTWPQECTLVLPVCTNESTATAQLFGFIGCQNQSPVFLPLEDAKQDEGFKELLNSGQVITWDCKEMYHLLHREQISFQPFAQDLHIAAFLLNSNATDKDALVQALAIDLPETFHDLTKKSKIDPMERVLPVYQSFVVQLAQKQEDLLKQLKDEGLDDLYTSIEKPLIYILFGMEVEGIAIDASVLNAIDEQITSRMDETAARIYQHADMEFNINSPKQLAEVLYTGLGLKTTGKKKSTSAEVLEKMADQHPIISDLLEYRKLSKIKSTYIEGLKKHIGPDQKIHTTFHQTMTQTGRLSSSEPNLQNISIRNEEGKEIRKAFIAPEGTVLLSADYSQIELRMLAHMAKEEAMMDAFNHDEDIHTRTATLIFDCPKEEVDDAKRRAAKTVNFGIVYGQTEFGLASQLDISRMEAREFMNSYFSKYPAIHRYMNGLIESCQEKGYVETMFHRRRFIPEINDKNFMTREFGKRAAMNAPIQGSAADLIKIAMIKVDQAMKEAGVASKMLLQIHDELIFLVPKEELETMKTLVKETMEQAVQLDVPLKADLAYGPSWYEAK